MFKKIIDFYKVSEPIPAKASTPEENERKLKRLQWATFLSATIGYGTYYVCRLSLNVIKKPIVDNGVFSETELGIIGSVLFFTYAIGKFTNGFLADRSNIKRLMSTGLLVTALESGFGLYQFLHPLRSFVGIERMVPVDGSCLLRGRSLPLV